MSFMNPFDDEDEDTELSPFWTSVTLGVCIAVVILVVVFQAGGAR